jgi:hypothetical protein
VFVIVLKREKLFCRLFGVDESGGTASLGDASSDGILGRSLSFSSVALEDGVRVEELPELELKSR